MAHVQSSAFVVIVNTRTYTCTPITTFHFLWYLLNCVKQEWIFLTAITHVDVCKYTCIYVYTCMNICIRKIRVEPDKPEIGCLLAYISGEYHHPTLHHLKDLPYLGQHTRQAFNSQSAIYIHAYHICCHPAWAKSICMHLFFIHHSNGNSNEVIDCTGHK